MFLINPCSWFIYVASSWLFFNSRINIEEELLYEFFGDEYRNYAKKTPILIPFIKGYGMDEPIGNNEMPLSEEEEEVYDNDSQS